jgi:hypothetical protein
MSIWEPSKPHYADEFKKIINSFLDYISKWSNFEE